MLTGRDVSPYSAHERSAATRTASRSGLLHDPGSRLASRSTVSLAVCRLDLSKESDETLMLLRVRRQCGYVLGESIAAFAPLERLGRDVLSILLVGKEPAKERLAVPRRESAKLDSEQAILIRSDLKTDCSKRSG